MVGTAQSQLTAAPNLTPPQRVPWTVWVAAAAIVSAPIGGFLDLSSDLSCELSIGRDPFCTPPHLLIQVCAAIGGITAIYFIVRSTFANDGEARARSVRVFGLGAPLGAFLCGWGALTILTSAPFDNW